ncbi:sugar transferase [Demequina sp. B12]|uniref:sugar transferase n=1 Tax=Demequina sp. B12 TaxID=2992757 RepID=UPI00237B71DE|nr:sugar transferase [Demequina sp. B12]MDE0573645.1 sugar transferase [Demequina sp. B12]
MTDAGNTPGAASTERMGGGHGWARKYRRRLLVTDVIVIAAIMLVAHLVRFGPDFFEPVAGPSAPAYWFVTLAISVLWAVQMVGAKAYEVRVLGHGPQEFQRILRAAFRTFAAIAIVGFLTQWEISRGYLLFALPLGTLALMGGRALWRLKVHHQRDRGYLLAQAIVVGPLKQSEEMIRRLRRARRAGYNVIGVCLPPTSRGELADDVADVPVLGSILDAPEIAKQVDAEFLILSGTDEMSTTEARRLGWALEGSGVGLIIAPAMAEVTGPRVVVSPVEGLPLLHVDEPQFRGGKFVLKYTVDRVWGVLGLILAAVPMLVIAIAVKATSPGPVFFRQTRVGLNHREFTMLKFRSMYTDADQRAAELERREDDPGNEVLFKMRDDPRVTSVGRFLRRFSLDELPQLINVVRGDMAIVGPRPPLPSEVEQWGHDVARRQLVKPGLTGLWQVSGRSDLDWEQSVRLDLYYAENWSIGGDTVIVLRTVWAVIAGKGAY